MCVLFSRDRERRPAEWLVYSTEIRGILFPVLPFVSRKRFPRAQLRPWRRNDLALSPRVWTFLPSPFTGFLVFGVLSSEGLSLTSVSAALVDNLSCETSLTIFFSLQTGQYLRGLEEPPPLDQAVRAYCGVFHK